MVQSAAKKLSINALTVFSENLPQYKITALPAKFLTDPKVRLDFLSKFKLEESEEMPSLEMGTSSPPSSLAVVPRAISPDMGSQILSPKPSAAQEEVNKPVADESYWRMEQAKFPALHEPLKNKHERFLKEHKSNDAAAREIRDIIDQLERAAELFFSSSPSVMMIVSLARD